MKLLDFFTGAETWGEFWRLLGQLDDDSRFARAQEDDEELAQRMIERGLLTVEDEKPWRPKAAGWTLLHEMLARMLDRQDATVSLLSELPAGVTKRRELPPQFPRPQTARSRARTYLKLQQEKEYDDKITDFAERAKDRWRAMSPEQQQAWSRPQPPG